jgi:DinB superfamily
VNEGEACGGCGFVYSEAEAPDAAQRVRMLSNTIAERLLVRPVNEVRRHMPPLTWSALEYGCHLRDDLLVQRERVLLARRVEHPTLTPMGRDERAYHDGYESQHVADVARQLVEAGRLFAHVLDLLDDDTWSRTVVYNWPEPADRSLRWVAVHTVHELVHHQVDIEHVLTGP